MEPIRLDNSKYDLAIEDFGPHDEGERVMMIIGDRNNKIRLSPQTVFHLSQIIHNRLSVKTVTTYELNTEL